MYHNGNVIQFSLYFSNLIKDGRTRSDFFRGQTEQVGPVEITRPTWLLPTRTSPGCRVGGGVGHASLSKKKFQNSFFQGAKNTLLAWQMTQQLCSRRSVSKLGGGGSTSALAGGGSKLHPHPPTARSLCTLKLGRLATAHW